MVEWLALIVSTLAFGVSVVAYRAGRPRLIVEAEGPVGFFDRVDADAPSHYAAVIVTVTNEGGSVAHISSVYLAEGGLVGKLTRGPKGSVEIPAGGARRTWIFDYGDLRQQLAEQARTQFRDPRASMFIRATVKWGRTMLRSNAIQVNPPGIATAHQTRKDIWRRRYRSWRHPSPMIIACYPVTPDELRSRTHEILVENPDLGVIAACELVPVVTHADGSREIVQSVDTFKVRAIRGRRSRRIAVPLIDDFEANVDDEFSWVIKTRGHLHWGQPAGAFTISQLPELEANAAALSRTADDEGES
ncbi:hypothetical protein ACQ856_17310 [Mycolicibacterium psychrotolerans]|uniref:hypothetical protein n=1 Tax=Mycolicibacterium psychrotolerans TaxID=216929 RepID=UPI003D678242